MNKQVVRDAVVRAVRDTFQDGEADIGSQAYRAFEKDVRDTCDAVIEALFPSQLQILKARLKRSNMELGFSDLERLTKLLQIAEDHVKEFPKSAFTLRFGSLFPEEKS